MNEIPTCTHIKDDGSPCNAIPVHNTPYCYFHRKFYQPPALPGDKNYQAPLLESHQTIQLAITHLYQAFLSKKIDLKEATFGLQMLRLASKTITAIEKQKKEELREKNVPEDSRVKKVLEEPVNPQNVGTGLQTRAPEPLPAVSALTSFSLDERSCAARALDLAQKARSASEPKRGLYDPYGCMPKNGGK